MMVAAETVFVINPTLHAGKLPYDVNDFAPVTGLVRINQGLLAHPSLPANTIAELIALAKQKPGEITYGTLRHRRRRARQRRAAGKHGRHQACAGALPRRHAGAQRRAGRPHHADVGELERLGAAVSRRQGQDAGDRQRQRLPRLPEVPTTAETVPGYEAVTWFGLFTTAGTPREMIVKINAEVRKLFADPAFLERVITPNMFESMVSSPEQFAEFIKADSIKWSKVLRDANIKVD